MSPWENDPVATVANPWDNDPIAPWESDPVAEEGQGYLSQLGDALGTGYQQMVAGTRASFNAATGDTADLSKNLAELGRLQREQDKAASPEDRAFQARMGVADKKWEAGDYIDSITDLFGAAAAEPGAAFKTAVQSAPNALVSIGTSVAGRGLGALAGGAAGIETGPGAILTGLGGALAGGAVANTLMESGPAIFDELNKRTGGLGAQLNDEQIKTILESDPGILTEGLKKGVTRGVTIGLIESLGLYGAGKVAAVPERAAAAAARSALAREGVNVASREAVEAALRDPALKALANKAGAETADQFSKLGNVARWGGASAIETGAAGAGEAGAQLLTEGKVTPSGVAMEMIGDAVMSPAGTALSKGAELAGMGMDALLPEQVAAPAGAVPPVDEAPDVEAEQRAAEAEAMAGVRQAAEAARANPTVQAAAGAMATAIEAAPIAPATADAVAEMAQQTIENEINTDLSAVQAAASVELPTEPVGPEARTASEAEPLAAEEGNNLSSVQGRAGAVAPLVSATRTNDTIRLEFDATGRPPTDEELRQQFGNVLVERLAPDIVSGSRGTHVIKLIAQDDKGRMSSKMAEESYTKVFGDDRPIRGQSRFQAVAPIEDRFTVGRAIAGDTNAEAQLRDENQTDQQPQRPDSLGESTPVQGASGVSQPSAFSDYLRTVTPTDRWTDSDYAAAQQFADTGDFELIRALPKAKRNAVVRELLAYSPEARARQEAADKRGEDKIKKQEKSDRRLEEKTNFKRLVPEGIEDLPDDIASASIGGRGVPKYADVAYMSAVEAGDLEGAQRMVDQAAKMAGYSVGPVWHGSPNKNFTRFDLAQPTRKTNQARGAFFFSTNKEFAEQFSGDGETRPFFISPEGMESPGMRLPSISEELRLIDRAKAKGAKGIKFDDDRDTIDTATGDVYVVFDPSQIKSADPITRDDAGNVIPLSQRFNPASSDIRESRAEGDAAASPQSIEDYQAILTRKLGLTNFQNIVLSNYGTLPNGVRLKGFVRAGSNKVFLNLNSINNEEELVDTFLEEAEHLIYTDPAVAAEWARLKELVPQDQLDALRTEMEARGYAESVWDEEAYNDIARKLGYEWLKQPVWRKAWEAIRSAVRRIFGLTDDKEINRVSAAIVAYAIEHQQSITDDVVAEGESRSSPFRESRGPSTDAIFADLDAEEPNSFEAYDAAKRSRLGEPPRGTAGSFSAPRYTADQFDALFEKWFAANDYAAFLAAIKASDATTYRPTMKKLMRAAKGGDGGAAKRVEWFRHVISGTTPAGATAAQPEATAATPTAQPATPPPPVKPPPPIPRASSKPRVTLNTVAMTWLAKKLGTSPTVNRFLRRARGRFVVRPDGTRVEVNEQLFKDPEQAAKTLAHEIGHFLDHLPAHILGANLVKRLAPLGDYKMVFGPLWDWAGGINNLNKVIKMEAIALSKDWRGDFDAKDKYRNSASELYADFVSAFLNDPQWTAQKAPNITLAFLEALDQKPAVSAAYFNLVNLIKGGALYKAVAQDRTAAQAAAVRDVLNRTNHTADKRAKWQRSFWELYTAVANRYTATAAKAGGYWANRKHRIENFGRDYVTKQEQAGMFASRAVSDLDNRMVNLVSQPLLTHFGKEGAGLLDRYLLNQRIIKERTATGEYLEQNPDEARQFLKWLVDKGSLGATVAAEVDAAADADLYNLGAKIIRQLHESQKFDDVYSEAQRVGAPPLAERGLFAFDVSGFMANPDGRTPESAAEDNQQIADTLGTGFADLEGIAQDYYGIMRGYAEEANNLGLFKPEVWNERIEPNLDSYVPFMVLDYFNGHTDAAIRSRVGTFKGTMPSQMAGWLKAKALIGRMQRQKQVLLLKGFFEKEGKQFGFADEMTPITDRNMDRAKADRMEREQDVAVLGYWDEGTFKWLKFDDKTAAESIQSFNPDDLNAMLGLLRTNANVWRTLVTVLSPAFIIRNAMRGVRTSWTRLGVKNAATAVKLILKSIPAGMRYGRYKLAELLAPRLAKAMKERDFKFIMDSTIVAQYALYTTEGVRPSPELQDLLDKGILTSAFMKDTGGMTQDEVQEGILAGLIAPDAMLRPSRQQQNWFDKTLRPNLGAIWAFMQNIAAIQEAAPKVSAYETLRGRTDMTEEMKQAIARMEGIPNPGVGGKMNKYLEFIFLFWRVALQGHRATLNSAMNPKTRGGFFLRFLASELAPKALYALAAAGVLDALMGGDDEDEQVDMAEAVKRLSPYKIQKDDALPLFWLKPDGGIEWMYGHKSIPENWTPIAIRIPASEEGRWASPASAFLMDKLFAPDMAPVDTNKFAGELLGGLLPGFNPTFERLGQYKAALFDPEPPRDAYRNRPIMPEDKWVDGSIPERMWGITKDVLTQAGLPLSTSNYRNENLPAGLTGLLSLPVLRTVVASDNYYGVLDEQRRRYDEKLASAAARNMRGEVTRDMVRRYESLKSKGEDNRTDIEAAEYDALRQWHNRDYEGSERRPGLMQDLREAAKAKQTGDDLSKAVLAGQAKDSAAALEASAQDLRELLRELRRESQ